MARDGSIYMAARARRYDPIAFELRQYDPLRGQLRRRLREECGARALTTEIPDAHFSHIAALALAKAGVIEYKAVLIGGTQASFDAGRVTLTRIAGTAAARAEIGTSDA